MTGTHALPFVAVLVFAVVMLVRSREVRPWVAVVVLLCGIYLGRTPVVGPTLQTVNWLVNRLF